MDAEAKAGIKRRALIACAGLPAAALLVGAACTQFVAWRKGYAPGLGQPWFGHFYAPWSYLRWRSEPWAAQSQQTFAMVTSGLYATGALATIAFARLALYARQRPTKHVSAHGTAAFGTEEDAREAGLLPFGDGPNAGVYVGALTDKSARSDT